MKGGGGGRGYKETGMLAVGGPKSDGDTHSVTLCSLYEVHIKIVRDKCLEQKEPKHCIYDIGLI